LAIVIVNRSLDAAKAIIAGNNVSLTNSISMASSFDVARSPDYHATVAGGLAAARNGGRKVKRPRYATGALS
jgi:hypothetical protein